MPTLAERNNNPGNLKDFNTGQFRKFNTPQEGYSALLNDLQKKQLGTTTTGLGPDSTLVDFSSKYAPASDKNNPGQHAANIANYMQVRPDAKLKDLDLGKWAEAVAKAEGYSGPTSAQSPNTIQGAPEVKPTDEGYKPWFKSEPTDSGTVSGLKAAGNMIPSAWNFGKNVVNSLNPINALSNISKIPGAFKDALDANQGSVSNTLGNTVASAPEALYKTVVPKVGQQILSGDLSGASKTMTEDPFGQTAPFVLAAEGGAKLADNIASKRAMTEYGNNPYSQRTIPSPVTSATDAFGKAVETIAKPVTAPAEYLSGKISNISGNMATGIVSKLTNLDPATIRSILENPKEFNKIQLENISRGGLAGEVKGAIDSRINDLSETGKGYQEIRNSNQTVTTPPNWIDNALKDHGFTIKKRKIQASTNSITRSPSDIRAVQEFYNNWRKKTDMSPNEFLNMRGDLNELAKWDKLTGGGKTKASETIGKDLYSKANAQIRNPQLEELTALDEVFAPEVYFLKRVKKDYFDGEGNLKDNAPSRIMNSSNKVELLKRLEDVLPGVTKRIEILKAAEDIERSYGLKVGGYTRALVGGAGFMTGGLPGYLVTEILTSPGTAVSILRKAGYVGDKAIPIIRALKAIGGDIGKSKALIPAAMNAQKELTTP